MESILPTTSVASIAIKKSDIKRIKKQHNDRYKKIEKRFHVALSRLIQECVDSGVYSSCCICKGPSFRGLPLAYCDHELCPDCAKIATSTSMYSTWFRCPECRRPSHHYTLISFADQRELASFLCAVGNYYSQEAKEAIIDHVHDKWHALGEEE